MAKLPCIGAIYPDDAWVDIDVQEMINEFRYFLPPRLEMITARTHCPPLEANIEAGKWLAENGEIEEAARRLMRYSPNCLAYFCTTVSFIRGVGFDQEICDRITGATGLPATTTSTAMVKALRYLGINRLALASPYMPDVEQAFINFFEGHGFEIVNSVALNLPDDHPLVSPEHMRRTAEEADVRQAEAIFVGCTGQKLGRLLDDMERILRKPVLTANQVTVWHASQLVGCEPISPGRGLLFSSFRPQNLTQPKES